MISKKSKLIVLVNFILLFSLVVVLGINQITIIKTNKLLGNGAGIWQTISKKIGGSAPSAIAGELTGNLTDDAIKLILTSGVPDIYGAELGVSFDAVQQSIDVMRQYDPTYGKKKITLAGDNLERYIDVALRISCEYCCGAASIIRPDGEAACGCAHSIAMRGLVAYLIQNHGEQYSNDELLRELARWKGMYFPKQMIKKMASQLQGGNFTPAIASLLLEIDLPDYGSGSKEAPLPSELENLPSMVGGC